jgi:hypothetical protein
MKTRVELLAPEGRRRNFRLCWTDPEHNKKQSLYLRTADPEKAEQKRAEVQQILNTESGKPITVESMRLITAGAAKWFIS